MVEITQADGQPFPAMPEHISSLHFAGKEHRIRKPADFFRIADRHRKCCRKSDAGNDQNDAVCLPGNDSLDGKILPFWTGSLLGGQPDHSDFLQYSYVFHQEEDEAGIRREKDERKAGKEAEQIRLHYIGGTNRNGCYRKMGRQCG